MNLEFRGKVGIGDRSLELLVRYEEEIVGVSLVA